MGLSNSAFKDLSQRGNRENSGTENKDQIIYRNQDGKLERYIPDKIGGDQDIDGLGAIAVGRLAADEDNGRWG